jgi:hypothetical protein
MSLPVAVKTSTQVFMIPTCRSLSSPIVHGRDFEKKRLDDLRGYGAAKRHSAAHQ